MQVKICGIKYKENLQEIIPLRPDYLGFIFYPKSSRFMLETLTPNDLAVIPSTIKKVGVFVNELVRKVIDIVESYNLDAVQIHGDERLSYMKELKIQLALLNRPILVFKVFGVDDSFDIEQLNDYQDYCDYFLFDTKTPKYGGSGHQFDWSVLENYELTHPVILSGGLDSTIFSEHINSELSIVALDFNSKLEVEPGRKDIEKVKAVLSAAKKI